MIIIAGLFILFGLVYTTNGYSHMHMRPELLEALMKHNGVAFGTPGREMFAGILFLGIGFWIIWKRKGKEIVKENAAIKKIVDSVDWKNVENRINKVKKDAKNGKYLEITAGNESCYAGLIDYISLNKNIYHNGHWIDTGWYLEVCIDVSEDYIKRHLEDYVSIDYPDSGVEFFKDESGRCSGWMRYYLGIPGNVSEKVIRARLGNI